MREPSVRFLPDALAREAVRVATRLREAGHQAWLVGGVPRDLALGREVHDLDVATSARPEEVEALFEVAHAVGRAFGTLVVPGAGGPIEVTTFRRERGYSDGRRPDAVAYTTELAEDAERRDFTANALYLDPLDDVVADPTGGLVDLAAGLLRAVGDPAARFAEDGLRILRLARFAAVLGFRMEPETVAAARRGLENLRGVSPERVVGEWEKAAKHRVVAAFASNLHELDALFVAHPALAAGLAAAGVVDRDVRARALAHLPATASADLALATLFLPSGAFDERHAEIALRALHTSRAARNRALALWKQLEELARAPEEPTAREWRLLARPTFAEDLLVGELTGRVAPEHVGRWRTWAADPRARAGVPEPLLDARELLTLGVPPGPDVGRLLRGLVDAQLEGRVTDVDGARAWIRAST